jgi:hypothetical protein
MMLLLLVLLGVCFDDAQAGAACRAAADAVRQGQYDEAVAKLQEALRQQPRESERLQYRDGEGLHKEAYFPHFVWAQARALQARAEKDRAAKIKLFREAVTQLELTRHPSGPDTLKGVQEELAALEKAAAAPDATQTALADLRQRVNILCEQENFEEARKVLGLEKELLDKNPNERTQLFDFVQGHRSAVISRYEKALDLALESMAVASPLEKPDSLPLLLQPVLLPKGLTDPPEGRFVWLRDFLGIVQNRLPELRSIKDLEGPKLIACARAFEEAGGRALAASCFPGYRAAMNIAQAVRWSRIQLLASGSDDPQLERLLVDSELVVLQQEKALGKAPERDAYRSSILEPHLERIRDERAKFRQRMRLVGDLDRWIARADLALADRSTMANPEALRATAKELGPLEGSAAWKESPAPVRAKALYARSILEAVAILLDADAPPGALDRASPGIRAARALDAGVDAAWKDRLSPKLKAWLERLDR